MADVTILAIAAVSSAALAAGTAVYSGVQQQNAGKIARTQAEQQAQAIADQRVALQDKAQQEEAARLQTLQRVLGSSAALRGARGLTLDSVGEDAIRDAATETAQRDLDTISVNAERESRSLGLSASNALLSGQAAEVKGNAAAVASYGQAYQAVAQPSVLKSAGYLSGA